MVTELKTLVNHELARDALTIIHSRPREIYRADRRFQVVRTGARFEGILQFSENAWAGWSRRLHPGEVITCEGWKRGMDDTPEGVNWSGARVPETAMWVQVWPMHGLFTPWPMDGFLRPLPDEEEA